MIIDIVIFSSLSTCLSGVQGLRSILFGSCNRVVNKPQGIGGENVCVARSRHRFVHLDWRLRLREETYLNSLKDAYNDLLGNNYYNSFVESMKMKTVDGIWDDHDLGVNMQEFYLIEWREQSYSQTFSSLSGSGSSSAEENWTSKVEGREGLYHARDLDTREEESGALLKIIFLDTRYRRQPHYIRSLGEINLPMTALVAAALRVAYTFFGLGMQYGGSILGEKQWAWLNETLHNSKADYNVIVSSIQVLTTNPAVESWGHFPNEKNRLLNLVARHNPKGVVLLSGDVHHGEMSSVGLFEELLHTDSHECTGDEAVCDQWTEPLRIRRLSCERNGKYRGDGASWFGSLGR